MDLINECEYAKMNFEDCLLICFTNLRYSVNTYQECLNGMNHQSLIFFYN